MHEIERHVLVSLPRLLGVDLSITNEVLLVWIAAAATFALVVLACRRRGQFARGVLQNLFETLIDLIDKDVVQGSIGSAGRAWAPFLLTLFFFILFCNLLGMVPDPAHFKPATANLSVTAGLALMVFALTLGAGVHRHGLLGFLRRFLPAGVPRPVAVLVVPIEIISWLAKPLSLAIRLFANMLAGHYLIMIFIGLEMTVAWFLIPLPLVGAVAMGCFELFVCFIQAFVFTLLTAIYIREALEAH